MCMRNANDDGKDCLAKRDDRKEMPSAMIQPSHPSANDH